MGQVKKKKTGNRQGISHLGIFPRPQAPVQLTVGSQVRIPIRHLFYEQQVRMGRRRHVYKTSAETSQLVSMERALETKSCVSFKLTRNAVPAKEQGGLVRQVPVRQDRLGLVMPVSTIKSSQHKQNKSQMTGSGSDPSLQEAPIDARLTSRDVGRRSPKSCPPCPRR
jgi:hypothetical protein